MQPHQSTDAPASATPAAETPPTRGKGTAMTVYILFLMGIMMVVTAPIGVVIAHLRRRHAEAWVQSHFTFQIRTFWFSIVILAIGLALAMHLIGYLVITLWMVWSIGRAANGIRYLLDNLPIPAPRSFGFGNAPRQRA
jgi:uncharacterized membrane protein